MEVQRRAPTALGMLVGLAASVWCVALGSACTQPCDDIDAWAARCGAAPRWSDESSSAACSDVTRRFSRSQLDTFGSCVTGLSCNDPAGLLECVDNASGTDAPIACHHLLLWGSACGLDPAGTRDDCASYQGTADTQQFALWVDCITSEGCPTSSEDERFGRCQSTFVPSGATEWVDACTTIGAWNQRCFALQPSLAGCLLEAQQYTPASYSAYATCLSEAACDDAASQLACLALRKVPDRERARTACQRILTWSTACGVSASVGDNVDTCMTTLARFTTASINAYADCITVIDCSQTQSAALCSDRLVMDPG
jgi:hypothetical protein